MHYKSAHFFFFELNLCDSFSIIVFPKLFCFLKGKKFEVYDAENGSIGQVNVFTFVGAKRSGSDRECKYFPIGINAREPLWR